MTSIRDTIVDEQLKHDLDGRLAVERQIFAIASHYFTVALQAILDARSITALVLDEALGPNVDHVVARRLAQLRIPPQLTDRFCSV